MNNAKTTAGAPVAPHFLYFADPMCSWCYGFAPVIERLSTHFADRLSIRLVMGGLRAGNNQAMTDQDRAYIRDAWTRVNQASGQPFDFAFFEWPYFVYDTEPACRAVVAMRKRHPDKALATMSAIGRAFYAGNRDVTKQYVLGDIAGEMGDDRAAFLEALSSMHIRDETANDFLSTKQLGVHGFPCLMITGGTRPPRLVTRGYQPFDSLINSIELGEIQLQAND